jgi:UDP-glucuronate decarboxylase
MKVLITGGLGFIGSHVAEKFYKEGHQIYIIDNLTTGRESNLGIKYKFMKIDVEDRRCEVFFRDNEFDIIIHLAAQTDKRASLDNPLIDTKTNIYGIVNMLEMARKFKIKKFIYISSTSVYGDNKNLPIKEDEKPNPLNPHSLNKYMGESYCEKYREIYGIETLIIRVSNSYGPRQPIKGESGIISVIMGSALSGKPVKIYGDGNQTRDFIYVEDVAEGIYRAVLEKLKGVYNLSTNTSYNINYVLDEVKKRIKLDNIVYMNKKSTDAEYSKIDNSKYIAETKWYPRTTLREGLRKTIEWYKGDYKPEKSTEDLEESTNVRLFRKKEKRDKRKGILPYLENIVAFLLVVYLTLQTSLTFLDRYESFVIDYKLIYILLIAIIYGTKQATISIILSCALHIFVFMQSDKNLLAFLYNINNPLQLAVYIGVGVFIGYSIDKRNREIYSKSLMIEIERDRNNQLNALYEDTTKVKQELRDQIINSKDSYGRVFEITKELEMLQLEDIFNAAINVVERVMETESVAIYRLNKDETYLRLMSKSVDIKEDIQTSIKVQEVPYLSGLLHSGEFYVNKELESEKPMIVAPLGDREYIFAVIFIYNLSFESMTLYAENKFRVVLKLVASALFGAKRIEMARHEEIYVEGTTIMLSDALRKIIYSKIQARNEFKVEFTVLEVNGFKEHSADDIDINDLSEALSKLLRESDYVGLNKYNRINLVLSNTSEAIAGFVIKRLQKSAVYTRLITDVMEYYE